METIKKQWWKILVVILVCIVIDIIGHNLVPQIYYDPPSRIFEDKTLFIPAVSVLFIITFGALAVIFSLIQENLPGKKLSKGVRYGIAFAGLWFFAMPELCLLCDSPLSQELITGAIDGGAVFLLALFVSVFIATDNSHLVDKRSKRNLISISLIAIFYTIGRYLNYSIVSIVSAYTTKPLATVTWTVGIGIWVGIMYWLLEQGLPWRSSIQKALWFGGLVFGTDWFLYHLFGLLFVEGSFIDILLRVGVDIVFVIAGVFVFEKFIKRQGILTKQKSMASSYL